MDGAIGTQPADSGDILTVLDLDAERVQALVARGVRQAGSAAEAVSVNGHVLSTFVPKQVVLPSMGIGRECNDMPPAEQFQLR